MKCHVDTNGIIAPATTTEVDSHPHPIDILGDAIGDRQEAETSEHRILAVARLSKLHGTNEAEFAPIVSDSYHPRGLGTELLRRMLQIGQEEKLQAIVGYILTSNYKMHSLCKKLGFEVQPDRGEGMLKAVFVC